MREVSTAVHLDENDTIVGRLLTTGPAVLYLGDTVCPVAVHAASPGQLFLVAEQAKALAYLWLDAQDRQRVAALADQRTHRLAVDEDHGSHRGVLHDDGLDRDDD